MKKLMYSFLISGFVAGSIVASVSEADKDQRIQALQTSLIRLGNDLARTQGAKHLDQQRNDAELAKLCKQIEQMKVDHQRQMNDYKKRIETQDTTLRLLVGKGNDDAATIMGQAAKISAQEAEIRIQEAKIKYLKLGVAAAGVVGAGLFFANTYRRF